MSNYELSKERESSWKPARRSTALCTHQTAYTSNFKSRKPHRIQPRYGALRCGLRGYRSSVLLWLKRLLVEERVSMCSIFRREFVRFNSCFIGCSGGRNFRFSTYSTKSVLKSVRWILNQHLLEYRVVNLWYNVAMDECKTSSWEAPKHRWMCNVIWFPKRDGNPNSVNVWYTCLSRVTKSCCNKFFSNSARAVPLEGRKSLVVPGKCWTGISKVSSYEIFSWEYRRHLRGAVPEFEHFRVYF